jgi:hypothetical protein
MILERFFPNRFNFIKRTPMIVNNRQPNIKYRNANPVLKIPEAVQGNKPRDVLFLISRLKRYGINI